MAVAAPLEALTENGQLRVGDLADGTPDVPLWIWGFGSIIWNPGFQHVDRKEGYVKGWKRSWAQGSTDNRGTPEAPGRTATMEPCPGGKVWGVAYLVPRGEQAKILEELEKREQQYDLREWLAVYGRGDEETPLLEKALCFIASPANPDWLGPAAPEALARQIVGAAGPAGPNWEYVLKLEQGVRELGEDDQELFDLAARIRRLRGQ